MRQGSDSEGPFGTPPDSFRDALERTAKQIQEELEAQRRALNFLQTVAANLDNEKLDDAAFRDFMRRSIEGMPGIDYVRPDLVKRAMAAVRDEEFPILPAESTGYVD